MGIYAYSVAFRQGNFGARRGHLDRDGRHPVCVISILYIRQMIKVGATE